MRVYVGVHVCGYQSLNTNLYVNFQALELFRVSKIVTGAHGN